MRGVQKMQANQLLIFGPYRLNPHTGQVWRGKQEVRLTGKAVAVLRYLTERAGQVVTKEELFQAVWPDTVVSDAALTSCIQELRSALRDHSKSPRYLKTIHRRGFQFLGKVGSEQQEGAKQKAKGKKQKAKGEHSSPTPSPQHPASTVVGREAELLQLHGWLNMARNGARQVVLVTGEPGIGKTTLLDAFLFGVRSDEQFGVQPATSPTPNAERPSTPHLWIGRGQCVEHYGAGEAYLPILEALGRLCREEEGDEVIAVLKQHAPTWLIQLPALLDGAELETLQHKTQGVTRERMLRELAEAIEVITADRPLVLVLEDLHWSDVSTLDLLSVLARRQERARLLIIGTYRPIEVLTRDHPLREIKQELQVHGQCEELALDFLTEAAVAEYLVVRFAIRPLHLGPLPRGEREPIPAQAVHNLAHVIHQRTDGNPLFMVNVVNDLIAQGVVAQTNGGWELRGEVRERALRTPMNLRQMIEQQIARVSPEERRVLEAASVAGAEFSAAAVAAGSEQSTEVVETHCDSLVRHEQFLRARGTSEWPDGTVAARYGFVHALYQEVLYEQLSANRRMRLHKQIGEREEQGYGNQAVEIAAELAVHFERGRDYRRAIQYLEQAGRRATQLSASVEARNHLTRALDLLRTLSDTPERTQQEFTLQTALGPVLLATNGFASPEAKQAYSRAWDLCQQMGENPHQFPVIFGSWAFSVMAADYPIAHEQAQRLFALAQRSQDSGQLMEAHYTLGYTLSMMGNTVQGQEILKPGATLYDIDKHGSLAHAYSFDPGGGCFNWIAYNLWLLGYPDQALQKIEEALALVQKLSHPFSLCFTLIFAGYVHRYRYERRRAQKYAEAVIRIATEQEFPHWVQYGEILRGWALSQQEQPQEGIAEIQRGLAGQRAIGTESARAWFLSFLVEACEKAGRFEEGLSTLTEAIALVDKTQERFYEAKLLRLKGELLLRSKGQGAKAKVHREAEACFQRAIELARQQQAKSWELRASTSLARLWQQQGKQQEAHKLLSDIYNWFTEGFDTKDLQEAKALLDELEH
jgi:DNA-binding winged helix-turn-helix (wHTH) protein/predicted ATPase